MSLNNSGDAFFEHGLLDAAAAAGADVPLVGGPEARCGQRGRLRLRQRSNRPGAIQTRGVPPTSRSIEQTRESGEPEPGIGLALPESRRQNDDDDD